MAKRLVQDTDKNHDEWPPVHQGNIVKRLFINQVNSEVRIRKQHSVQYTVNYPR